MGYLLLVAHVYCRQEIFLINLPMVYFGTKSLVVNSGLLEVCNLLPSYHWIPLLCTVYSLSMCIPRLKIVELILLVDAGPRLLHIEVETETRTKIMRSRWSSWNTSPCQTWLDWPKFVTNSGVEIMVTFACPWECKIYGLVKIGTNSNLSFGKVPKIFTCLPLFYLSWTGGLSVISIPANSPGGICPSGDSTDWPDRVKGQ